MFAGAKRRYLWRRRAPVFAHGLGIVLSADVARFIAELALKADGLSQAGSSLVAVSPYLLCIFA